ncbi:O-methyltransferase [Chryseolinea sp. T2]|uniref:O-methyltransferase n=1 Tax=Chryseolinea sp. T2 TaxID=3129255 RepID=UPI00307693C2
MNDLFGKVDEYIQDLVGQEDSALKAAAHSVEENGIPPIAVSVNQGKFLHVLALAVGARRILEVGTLAGYSTIWMARALPSDGKLITLEYDPKHAEVARKNIANAGLSDKVEVRVGKAIDSLPNLEKENLGPFDMIFIDADKPPYKEYYEWAIKLSRPGTLIIADNVIREGKVLDPNSDDDMVQGVRRFNQAMAENSSTIGTIIQNVGAKAHDGMAIMVVK